MAHTNNKSIIFIPDHFYLSYPDICYIKERIPIGDNNTFRISHIPTLSPDEESFENTLATYHLRDFYVPIPLLKNPWEKVAGKLLRPFILFLNQRRIRSFLKKERPSFILLSSDLGRVVQKRLFLEEAMALNIPIKIFYTCELSLNDHLSKINFLYPYFFNFITLKFGPIRYLRALTDPLFIKRRTIGSYAFNSEIFVPFKHVIDKLAERKISLSRLHHVQSPLIINNPKPIDFVQSTDFLVTIFTQCIQLLWGENFVKKMYRELQSQLHLLPANVKVVIKLHPKETPEFIHWITKLFSPNRLTIIKDEIETKDLIMRSNVAIAHFSRVLLSAMANNIIILSLIPTSNSLTADYLPINFKEDTLVSSIPMLISKITNLATSPFPEKSPEMIATQQIKAEYFPSGLPEITDILLSKKI